MTPEQVARKSIDAFNRHDRAAYAALIAPDVVAYDPVYPEPLRGKKAIMRDLDASFAAIPDVHYEILKLLTKDRDGVIEFRISGTHTGAIEGPSGSIPATNNKVSWIGAEFFRIDSKGLVVEERRYFDSESLRKQFGLAR
ncbi:ester cyclase [Candidatus Bathyarchaeota archaeon]|nr:MAG: ester cyclase [Candidatus Bathyarchaeota archaeon]